MKITDNTAEKIASVITSLVQSADKNGWKCPWVKVSGEDPQNYMYKRAYTGFNSFILSILQSTKGYKTANYITFENVKSLGLSLNKDKKGETEKPFPVSFYSVFFVDDNGKIVKKPTEEEKEVLTKRFSLTWYNVWNLDQTNFPEKYAEKYAELTKKEVTDNCKKDVYNEALESLINGSWICPINQVKGNEAYYSPSSNSITLPMKEQFKSVKAFYGTATHEMSHSTAPKLKRDIKGLFGSAEYAKEELVAELSSAIFLHDLGIEKDIEKNHLNYVANWMSALRSKEVTKEIIEDVLKVVAFTNKRHKEAEEELEKKVAI